MSAEGKRPFGEPSSDSVFDFLLDPERDLLGHGESQILVREVGPYAMGDDSPLLLGEAAV